MDVVRSSVFIDCSYELYSTIIIIIIIIISTVLPFRQLPNFKINLTELPSQVQIVLGTQDGTGQGSQWLIECPVILIAHI